MKRFYQILTLLLLALMVPASTCCYGVDGCVTIVDGGSRSHDEHEHHDGGEHHAPSSCPGETLSHSQVPMLVILPAMQMVELTELILVIARLQDDLATATEFSGLPMTTAPPELRATWPFTQRTALPVRAPSILA